MSVFMKVDGFRDIEKALAELPRGTAKGVARRVMKKELQPVAAMAEALWPGANQVMKISSQVKGSQLGDVSFRESKSTTNMFVGATEPHAHLVEWGTGPRYQKAGRYTGMMPPQPFLQPAWDLYKGGALEGLGKRMWEEISKTVARRAKKAAKR